MIARADGWTIALHWGKSGGWWFERNYTAVLCMGRLAITWIPRDLHPLIEDCLRASPACAPPPGMGDFGAEIGMVLAKIEATKP